MMICRKISKPIRRQKKPFFRFSRASASDTGKNKHANAREQSVTISQKGVKEIMPPLFPKIRRATATPDKVCKSPSHFTWKPVARALMVGWKCRRRGKTKYSVTPNATKIRMTATQRVNRGDKSHRFFRLSG